MTQLVDLIQGFASAEDSVHALEEWPAFKQAKTDLKKAFHAIDKDLFSKEYFYASVKAQCGAKTLKKIEEFTSKEHSFFTSVDKGLSLPDFFLSAAGKLEAVTRIICQKAAYQKYRSAKKKFKRLVKRENPADLQSQLKTADLPSHGIDVAKIIEKMEYWTRKALQ